MSYTIQSAAFANGDHTAAIIQTEDYGAVLISQADTPDLWAAMLSWGTPTDYSPPPPTLDDTKAECKRRILAVASIESQSNMNAYINRLNSAVSSGGTLTDAQRADIALFNEAMDWVGSMRAMCATMVGNATYQQDSHWPALGGPLAAFAARF